MLIEAFEKALITALVKHAGKVFKKNTYKKQIEQSVHGAFTEHASDLLILCGNDKFAQKLFSLAAGEFFNPKELVDLGVASSQNDMFNFSRAKIIKNLETFSTTLMNIFHKIDPSAGQMPNAFSKFHDSIDRLSIEHRNTEISESEFEKIWERMQKYNLSSEISLLRYIGFRLSRKEPPSLKLLDVFVPLDVEILESHYASDFKVLPKGNRPKRIGEMAEKEIPFARFGEKEKGTETVPFSSLMTDYRYITVLGDPGSGKTTLLKWIAILATHGKNRLQKEFNLNELLLALPVSVGQLAKVKNELGKSASVFEALAHYFKSRNIGDASQLRDFFKLCFKAGKCLLLLDGLDEVKSNERDMIRNWLELFVSNNSNNRYLVSSRIVGYIDFQMPSEGIVAKVQPFDDKQVKKYVEEFSKAYFRWETRDEESEAWRREAEKLLKVLDNYSRLDALARNPFLLSGLALIQRAEGRLPRHRVQFYDIFARCLCETWSDARCMVTSEIGCEMSFEEEAIPVLGTLAIKMTNEYPAGRAPKEFVLSTLAEALNNIKKVEPSQCRQAAQNFLNFTEKDLQLFLERGPDEWGFLHLTFQEFFATAGLHYNEDFEEAALTHLFNPGWEEIIRLGVGYLAIIQTRGKAAANFIKKVAKAKWEKKPWVIDVLGLNMPLSALLCAEGGNAIPPDLQCLIAEEFMKWFLKNDSLVDFADSILTDMSLTNFRDTLAQPFTKALNDEDLDVRIMAADALGTMKAETAIPDLIEALNDENSDVRMMAVDALGTMKAETAIPDLIEALNDENSDVRERAAFVLGTMKAETAIPKLIETLNDENSDVRENTVLALGIMKADAAIPKLIETLHDENSDVLWIMALALRIMNAEIAIPDLIEALNDENSDVRGKAAFALGTMKAETAIPDLIEALNDENSDVRGKAADALGTMKAKTAIPKLIETLYDENSDVRGRAAFALGKIEAETAVLILIETLKDENSDVRENTVLALGIMKADAAIPKLIETLYDENSDVRGKAAHALGVMRADTAIPKLVEVLNDENSDVRGRAAHALGVMRADTAIPKLVEVLNDENSDVRGRAAHALGVMRADAAIPKLIETLNDENSDVRGRAADALGEIKAETAVPNLIEALRDENSIVRGSAANALLRLI